MYRIFVILLLAGSGHSQDIEKLLKDIFTPPPIETSTIPTTTTSTAKPVIEIKPTTFVPPPNSNVTSCKLDGKDGVCVVYYLCNTNKTISTDGVGVLDIRAEGPCPSYVDVCCFPPDQRPSNDPLIAKPDPSQLQREGCGWANPNGVGMRTTGERDGETKFGEFPWMVAILNLKPEKNNIPNGTKILRYVSGGSLIHPSVVLTAAHNVAKTLELRVRAGEWDTQIANEIYPHQDREVESIVVHKDFNNINMYYDVAVLFLKSPVDMAPNVGVVCLPPYDVIVYPDTRCYASGWGKDKFDKESQYQVILKKVEVPAVDHQICQDRLRTTRLSYFFRLHSSFMCAGGKPGKDTCKGDGGSPLVCPILFEKDRYVQNGIVSWGIGCGDTGIPGVYVDVSKVRNWIDDEVKARGYMSEVYTY